MDLGDAVYVFLDVYRGQILKWKWAIALSVGLKYFCDRSFVAPNQYYAWIQSPGSHNVIIVPGQNFMPKQTGWCKYLSKGYMSEMVLIENNGCAEDEAYI